MADREGNVLRPPGTGSTPEVKGDEILASYARFTQKGRTFKADATAGPDNDGILPAGTVVARETATKKYVAYDGAGAGGAETAKGILRTAIDVSTEDKLGLVVFSGIVKNSKIEGLDAGAIAELNGRVDADTDWFIF
jgi:hypothetical protein